MRTEAPEGIFSKRPAWPSKLASPFVRASFRLADVSILKEIPDCKSTTGDYTPLGPFSQACRYRDGLNNRLIFKNLSWFTWRGARKKAVPGSRALCSDSFSCHALRCAWA